MLHELRVRMLRLAAKQCADRRKEMAVLLGVSLKTVYNMIDREELNPTKLDPQNDWIEEHLEKLLKENSNGTEEGIPHEETA